MDIARSSKPLISSTTSTVYQYRRTQVVWKTLIRKTPEVTLSVLVFCSSSTAVHHKDYDGLHNLWT